MYKKLISSILVVALLNLVGCYSFQNLSKEDQEPDFPLEQYPIKLILNNGGIIYSDAYNHTNLDSTKGIWVKIHEDFEKINSDEIKNIRINKSNAGTTTVALLIFFGLSVVGIVAFVLGPLYGWW